MMNSIWLKHAYAQCIQVARYLCELRSEEIPPACAACGAIVRAMLLTLASLPRFLTVPAGRTYHGIPTEGFVLSSNQQCCSR